MVDAQVAQTRQAAKEAGLVYVPDYRPGITRKKHGKSFIYFNTDGSKVTDKETLNRIKSLVIPPAWNSVWISPKENSHIQVTGLDARNRKQYRYHKQWSRVRNETKFFHVIDFVDQLPKIRARVARDLEKPGLPKEKIAATAVSLLDLTAMRVGNEQYEKENQSYGLTTLHTKHVTVSGDTIKFSFRGKSGVYHEIDAKDKRLAKVVRKCLELPGWEVFQYIDEDGEKRSLQSEDINQYLTDVAGIEYTAKDFRTWSGTVEAAAALYDIGPAVNKTEAKKNLHEGVCRAAKALGNRPATCKKFYVHPKILKSYEDQSFFDYFQKGAAAKKPTPRYLTRIEAITYTLLTH